MVHEPGRRYAYCSASINLVGGALATATSTWLPALFDRTVARPLQFSRYYWNVDRRGEGYLGGGAYVRPRDLLKLGPDNLGSAYAKPIAEHVLAMTLALGAWERPRGLRWLRGR